MITIHSFLSHKIYIKNLLGSIIFNNFYLFVSGNLSKSKLENDELKQEIIWPLRLVTEITISSQGINHFDIFFFAITELFKCMLQRHQNRERDFIFVNSIKNAAKQSFCTSPLI